MTKHFSWSGSAFRVPKVICIRFDFFFDKLSDWFKNSRHVFIQSEEKLKPLVTHLETFSRALSPLMYSSFDWFTGLFVSFVIG